MIFSVYRPLLAMALRNRWKVIAIAVASVVAGVGLFIMLDKEFMPAADQGRYMVRLETPIDYSLPRADAVMKQVDDRFATQEPRSRARSTLPVRILPRMSIRAGSTST